VNRSGLFEHEPEAESAMETGNRQRLHHWDFSRALYLVLGIPFHAAVIYSLSHEWSVASPEKSELLTWLADFLHSFRMPGFFLLAGLFSMMLLDRQGVWPWLKSRLVRLGLPLLSATLLIVPFQIGVQQMALAVKGALPASQLPARIAADLTHFGEPWISHLWFLWVLIAYCIGLAILQALSRGSLRARLEAFVAWVGANRILSLAAFAAICELAARAQEIVVTASPYYGNAVINYNLYVVYFGFGALVYSSRKLNDLLLRPGPVAALGRRGAGPLCPGAAHRPDRSHPEGDGGNRRRAHDRRLHLESGAPAFQPPRRAGAKAGRCLLHHLPVPPPGDLRAGDAVPDGRPATGARIRDHRHLGRLHLLRHPPGGEPQRGADADVQRGEAEA
jgi:hypothetical protein